MPLWFLPVRPHKVIYKGGGYFKSKVTYIMEGQTLDTADSEKDLVIMISWLAVKLVRCLEL